MVAPNPVALAWLQRKFPLCVKIHDFTGDTFNLENGDTRKADFANGTIILPLYRCDALAEMEPVDQHFYG